MLVFSIDPGVSGAICVFKNKDILDIYDVPTMVDGKKNKRQINSAQVTHIFKSFVKEGEILYQIDSTRYEALMQEAEARLHELQELVPALDEDRRHGDGEAAGFAGHQYGGFKDRAEGDQLFLRRVHRASSYQGSAVSITPPPRHTSPS